MTVVNDKETEFDKNLNEYYEAANGLKLVFFHIENIMLLHRTKNEVFH